MVGSLWGGRSRGQVVGVVGLRGDKGLECEFTYFLFSFWHPQYPMSENTCPK